MTAPDRSWMAASASKHVTSLFLPLEAEEVFFRGFRDQAFDVSELSFSSFMLEMTRGDAPNMKARAMFRSRYCQLLASCQLFARYLQTVFD
jgi:hypothetical protein